MTFIFAKKQLQMTQITNNKSTHRHYSAAQRCQLPLLQPQHLATLVERVEHERLRLQRICRQKILVVARVRRRVIVQHVRGQIGGIREKIRGKVRR